MATPLPLPVALAAGAVSGLLIGALLATGYVNLLVWTGIDGYDPWILAELPRLFRANRAAFWNALAAILAPAALLALFACLWTLARRRQDYGAAHWQTPRELRRNGMLAKAPGAGFVCAKLGPPGSRAPYIACSDHPHVLMVAPTRAGKGVGFVIPNLLTFQGSIVALDVKGELFDQTSRARARQGDDVFRFSPFDWAHGTHRYNPLAPIAALPDPDRQFTDVAILADLFLDRENNGANRTFSEAGKSIFVAAAMLALERGTPTLGAVRAIVTGDGTNRNEIYAGYAQETRHAVTRMLWRDAAATSDRTLASNLQALMTGGLKAWDHPAVLRATAANDIDFAAFRRRPQALYLSISEDHIQTLAPLLRLLFADLIRALRDHEPGPDEPWPVMIMIDEFQQMGAMPYLERAIHTLASYGGRVAMIAQSLAALEEIYGPNGRKSLETGAGVRLYIAPRDETTIKEVSAAVGQTTAEAVTQSFGASKGLFGPKGTSARLEARPLLSETAARTMDPDAVIVLAAPQHPVKAERIKFYEDPLFAAMMAAQEGQPYPFPPRQAAETTPETDLADDRSERAAAGTRRRQRLASAPKAAVHPLERVDPSTPLSADQRTRLAAATEAAEQAIALQPWRIGAGAHAH